jgi:hypothetical protein
MDWKACCDGFGFQRKRRRRSQAAFPLSAGGGCGGQDGSEVFEDEKDL